MCDLREMAEIIEREEKLAGKWLAMHASEATPRTRHIPPTSIWPALLLCFLLGAASLIAVVIIAAQAA